MMKKAKIKSPKKTSSVISTDNEMSKLIFLILIVALIFAVFYVITIFITKKDDNEISQVNPNEDTEVVIQYSKILAGNILTHTDGEYYVLVYFNNDKYLDLYRNYLAIYSKIDGAVPYYFVDMDDVFNKSFVGDKSNFDFENIEKLKFSQTTLLRVNNGNIVSTYEGNEQITGKLGRMTK